MNNPSLDASIKSKLVIDGDSASAPAGVHVTDLFVGDACTILDIDRPAEDRGSADALIPKYGLLLSAAGCTVVWSSQAFSIYKDLSDEEVQHLQNLATA
jgi:hypothetical protein